MVRWEQECEQSLDVSTECTQGSLSCGMEPKLRNEGGQGPGAWGQLSLILPCPSMKL